MFIEKALRSSWSRNRIGTEVMVRHAARANALKADVVLYDRQMNPFAVVECKSDHIPLTEQTAVQAARYNSVLKAPCLCVTNGISEWWFGFKNEAVEPRATPLDMNKTAQPRDAAYWIERGFIANDVPDNIRGQAVELLNRLWPSTEPVKWAYLPMEGLPTTLKLAHYYRLMTIDESAQMALSVVAVSERECFFAALLHRNRRNEALFLWPLATNELDIITPDETKTVSMNTLFPDGLFAHGSIEAFADVLVQQTEKA